MRRFLKRAARDEGGASAVEMALTLSVFMVLTVGAIDYALYLWTANALQQTAIQTARCMGVLQTDCAVSHAYSSSATTIFAEKVAGAYGVPLNVGSFYLSDGDPCGGQGTDNAHVIISYNFNGVAPGLVPGINNAMTAQACFPNQS